MKRLPALRASLAVAAITAAAAVAASPSIPSSAQSVPAPLPSVTPAPPPAVTPPPVPTAAPSPVGKHKHRDESSANASPSPAPSPTPTSPAFSTLDGTWELQEQFYQGTRYSHITITQTGDALSGYWTLDKKTKVPITGSYDGHAIRIVAKDDTSTWTFSGYVETASDMIGLLDFGKGDPIAFTATHRKSSKRFFDNITPGTGSPGGAPPGAGGGFPGGGGVPGGGGLPGGR